MDRILFIPLVLPGTQGAGREGQEHAVFAVFFHQLSTLSALPPSGRASWAPGAPPGTALDPRRGSDGLARIPGVMGVAVT